MACAVGKTGKEKQKQKMEPKSIYHEATALAKKEDPPQTPYESLYKAAELMAGLASRSGSGSDENAFAIWVQGRIGLATDDSPSGDKFLSSL